VDQADVSVVRPPHEIGRRAILAMDLEDLGVSFVLAHAVSRDDEPVSDVRLHRFFSVQVPLFGTPAH
jgi:hypothetical protein